MEDQLQIEQEIKLLEHERRELNAKYKAAQSDIETLQNYMQGLSAHAMKLEKRIKELEASSEN